MNNDPATESDAVHGGSGDTGDDPPSNEEDSTEEDRWDWQAAVAETDAEYVLAMQVADEAFATQLPSTDVRTQAALEQREADAQCRGPSTRRELHIWMPSMTRCKPLRKPDARTREWPVLTPVTIGAVTQFRNKLLKNGTCQTVCYTGSVGPLLGTLSLVKCATTA